MTNPWALEHLAKDRQDQLRLDAPSPPVVKVHHQTLRHRLGWSLINLGARLALDPAALVRANHAG